MSHPACPAPRLFRTVEGASGSAGGSGQDGGGAVRGNPLTGGGRITVESGALVPEAPRVSVVIPTYGMGWLAQALESARAQTFRSFEIIVVDDASPEPVRPSRLDDLVLIRQEQNSGPGGARNVGCAHARGEFIAFLDSDDWWFPGKLERQVAFHERRRDLVLSATDLRYYDGSRTWPPAVARPRTARGEETIRLERLFLENCICTSTVMVTKAAFDRTPGMVPLRRMGEDYGLWLRLALIGPVGFLAEVLTDRRIHGKSLMQQATRDGSWAREEMAIYNELLAEHAELRGSPMVRAALARLHFEVGYEQLVRGGFAEARRALARSLAFNPVQGKAWLSILLAGFHLRPRRSKHR